MTYTLKHRWPAWLVIFGLLFAGVVFKCGDPPFHDRWGMVVKPAAAATVAKHDYRPRAPITDARYNRVLLLRYGCTTEIPRRIVYPVGGWLVVVEGNLRPGRWVHLEAERYPTRASVLADTAFHLRAVCRR